MISAGIPTIFIDAKELGLSGTELQDDINSDAVWLEKFELIRAHGAVKMGLIDSVDQAATRQHTPKVAFVSSAKDYVSSSGKPIEANSVDLLARALSMGKLHHAMMGTAAVAIACAASVDGTVVNLAAGGGNRESVTFGHPSGTLKVGAVASQSSNGWTVNKAIMSRSARILMEGWVRVPSDTMK
jgi:2-methylaconitate cis-trans-isomerase PrpF